MATPAGKRDRRILILRATTSPDAYNEPIETWSTLVSLWAEYKPLSDGERYRAGEMNASIMARFSILHATVNRTIDPRDRIQFDGRTWDITGVKAVDRNNGIEISATARADAD
jgi:SPP1 family predicted phage head-tail adaptor